MLDEKNVVVTGANRGIGFETVRRCLKNGACVFAVVRKATDEVQKKMKSLEHGDKIKIFECDFADEESIKKCASKILAQKEPIYGLANIAGIIGSKKGFSMTSMQEIRNVFDVNFFAPLYFTQRLLKNMIRNKCGSIVNVSSIAAIDGGPGELEYCASKAALIGATKKLSRELGAFGIRVNSVAPGITGTDMARDMDEQLMQETLSTSVFKRLATPEEIAETIVWLLSANSNFITGQTIRVDGGM